MRSVILFILLIPNVIWAQSRRYELIESVLDRVIPGVVAVKLKPTPKDARIEHLQLNELEGVISLQSVNKRSANQRRDAPSVLDGVYIVKIEESLSPVSFCNKLLKYPEIEYAEAILKEELFHTPNDPSAQIGTGNQGYLDVIKAYSAWDITKGSEDIVIAIIDTGADLGHVDLVNKFYQNLGEAPVANGIDEDGNGYIDDIWGYDFADDDNNAQADGSQHGTHVSGIAGANTNNGIGIAGVGYQTKISALKGFSTVGNLSTGVWEAVIYAADNGYDILNLSWGGHGYSSQFYQDIIDYCVLEKDAVVIAAAGNTNADLDFYPASYDHVLSVAATTLTDTKWSNSTYSDFVDISAPGQSIYSTQNGDTYNTDSGTSHAAPQVAGVAALVKSVFPNYNALQIMEQVRVTADNIYGVTGNEEFTFKLGKGRLNAYRAVTENNSRSLRALNLNYNNSFGAYAFFGDTLSIEFDLTNYLAGLNSPVVSIESTSPYASILTSNLSPGAFQSLETKHQNNLKIFLSEDTPTDTKIGLRFKMSDGGYTDFQNISIVTEPDLHAFDNGIINATIIGDGSIGYIDDSYSEGYNWEYNGQPVLSFGGLIIATSSSDVQDNVTNDFVSFVRDDDFQVEKHIKLHKNEGVPKFAYSEFSSKNGDFWIEQSIIPSEDKSLMILSYRIINISGNTISNLSTGFFADYELGNALENHATWDAGLNALVFNDNNESDFGGLKILNQTFHYVALDMLSENGNSRDIQDSFSDADKYAQLIGSDKTLAGAIGVGNDVAGLVSLGSSGLATGDEVRMTIVIAFADSYASLDENFSAASSLFDAFIQNPQVIETFYSCKGNDVIIDPIAGSQYQFFEDPLGTIGLGTSDQLFVNNITTDTAIYVRNLDGLFPSDYKKIKIRIIDQVADFSPSTDTLYLDHPTVNSITFTDLSFKPNSWLWDFGNGTGATIQNPIVNFETPGNYDISLTINSDIGCEDLITKKIVVANRPASPSVSAISLCIGEIITLNHPTDQYVVYDQLGNKLDQGSSVNIGPYTASSSIKIAQVLNGFESLPVQVDVTINPLKATYSLTPDLSSSETKGVFTFTGGDYSTIEWRLNNQIVSTESSFSYAVDGSTFDVQLSVSNTSCADLLVETISFSPSPTPIVTNQTVCFGDDLTIKPINGNLFGFYTDQSLTNLISKGSELKLNQIQSNLEIYVVGLDNILLSSPVAISITVVDFQSIINATPGLLDLSNSQTVSFSASPNTVSAKWYINDQLVDQSLEPTLLFNTPGEYEIRLEAKNPEGCASIVTLNYIVVNEITGIISESYVNAYPNPVKPGGLISLESTPDNVQLISLNGAINHDFKYTNNEGYIPLSVKAGLYLLLVNRNGHTHAIKLVIE